MKQDIIPYSQLRYARVRSERPLPMRSFSVVTVEKSPSEAPRIVEVDTYVLEPAPMTRPIESLSSEEKVLALERALQLAREDWKRERRKHRGFRRRFLIQ